jgi:hypothetical protein
VDVLLFAIASCPLEGYGQRLARQGGRRRQLAAFVAWKGRVERKGTNLAVDEYFSSKLSIVLAFGETVKQSGFSGT